MATEKQDGAVTTTKSNKKTLIIVIIVAVVIVAALVGALIWALNRGANEEYSDDFFDPLAETGLLPDMSEDAIREELNRVVEEGAMNISIAGRIVFEDGESQGLANIMNSEANHYIQKVTITLDDTGEILYESGGIKPGQYIQYITLARALEPGQYETTATFTAYTQEERQIVGSVGAKVSMYVLN